MLDFSRSLGETVRKAREKAGLTQNTLADKAHIDPRTILNIENNHGNPKLQILFPLVRILKIPADEIFYPEIESPTSALERLQLELSDCSESKAEALLTICHTVLTTVRIKENAKIK